MRKAAKELAERMDYQPDFRATSLRFGSGHTIGVLLPKIDRHFFSTVVRGVDEVATSKGYNVLICQSHESQSKEVELIKSMMNGKVDGMIVSVSASTRDGEHFVQMVRKGVPLLFFDRTWETLDVSKVVIDDYLGACMSMEHLIAEGCNHIVHFAGPQQLNVYKNRTFGYIDTMKKHGREVNSSHIFDFTITRDTGYKAMREILKMDPRPDAIFSSGDFSALGALICCREHGIDVPAEMAIAGFANEPFDALISPSLTSVDQHAAKIGEQAAALLIEEMNSTQDKTVPKTILIKPELIIRESTMRKKTLLK